MKATRVSSEAQNPFNCPICLHVFKDPVTTSCGHNFCMKCINSSWDRDFQKGVFSCPICREGFNQRPTLRRNTVLCELVERMRDAPKAGPGDVACDVCTGQKLKAIKSCMVCLASYCQSHIQPHFKSEAFKKHNLVKPGLQQQICPQHHKALEIYCDDDQRCICVLCLGDNHRGHKTNSAAAQMVERKKALKERHMRIKQIAGDKKKKAKEFGRAVTSHKRFAQAAMKHIDRTFTELISSLQKRQAQVKGAIQAHIKQEVAHAENRIQMLNKDNVTLQKEENTLESLLQTEHYNDFFQNDISSSEQTFDIIQQEEVNKLVTFKNVETSVSEFKKQLERFCEGHKDKILKTVADAKIITGPLHSSLYAEEDRSYPPRLSRSSSSSEENIVIED